MQLFIQRQHCVFEGFYNSIQCGSGTYVIVLCVQVYLIWALVGSTVGTLHGVASGHPQLPPDHHPGGRLLGLLHHKAAGLETEYWCSGVQQPRQYLHGDSIYPGLCFQNLQHEVPFLALCGACRLKYKFYKCYGGLGMRLPWAVALCSHA